MRALCALFCLCWFATAAAASSGAAPPLVSAQDAVPIAQDFAEGLNLSVTGVPTATFLDPGRYSLTPPSWSLRFDQAVTFQIDATTGQVLSFDANLYGTARRTRAGERTLSQGQVVDTATKVAEAMGLPTDAVLRSVTRDASRNEWRVTWGRQTHGIPFRDDWFTVYVAGASAQPTSAHLRWSSLLPRSTEVKVSKDRAQELARRFATKRGPLLKEPNITATLEIVHPNGHWTKKPLRHIRYDSPTRLAWVVSVERRPSNSSGMVFWIDAANGSLLGGTEPAYGWARSSGG